ncbi:MAG: hypothetical protein DCC55_09045 [Chloroflexi bacterium]|nr:MAG: hypothetical protein DCC55_09045 [Chloroflexota bacterium]
MLRLVRPSLFVALGLAVILTAVLMSGMWQSSSAAPSAAIAAEVGVAPVGRNAVEFVGIVDQDGLNFSYYGYLTYIAGITDTLLFTDPISRTEATARFTFYGAANMTGRAIVDNLFNLNASGVITYYFDETQGADFDDPSSFTRGIAIASATTRFQNVLVVISPDRGIANGVAELTQTSTTPFELAGQSHQLGRNLMQQRFTYSGFGTRLEPTIPRAEIVIAANGEVTGLPSLLPLIEAGAP